MGSESFRKSTRRKRDSGPAKSGHLLFLSSHLGAKARSARAHFESAECCQLRWRLLLSSPSKQVAGVSAEATGEPPSSGPTDRSATKAKRKRDAYKMQAAEDGALAASARQVSRTASRPSQREREPLESNLLISLGTIGRLICLSNLATSPDGARAYRRPVAQSTSAERLAPGDLMVGTSATCCASSTEQTKISLETPSSVAAAANTAGGS